MILSIISLLKTLHYEGLLVGAATFLIIGLFHPLVIKAEYYWGVKSWWLFFIAGLITLCLSLCLDTLIGSILLGVTSFSCFWSIFEVFEQKKRVERGWFPKNPSRMKKDNIKP